MEIHEVDKKTMEALKLLGETNMKISEAKTLLIKIKSEEELYLSDREKVALGRIQALVDRSQELLDQASGNFDKVKELFDTVSAFVELLEKAHDGLSSLIVAAETKFAVEEARLTTLEESLKQREQQVQSDYVRIDNLTKSLDAREKKINEDMRKLASDRAAFERSIKRITNQNI